MPPSVETHLVNTVLTNGARYYVDHAHPEYSTPECANPLELVVHDKAGEEILRRSMAAARRIFPDAVAGRRLQEQLRRQGQLVRLPRELPDGPGAAVRQDRHRRRAPLRHPPDLHRRRQGRHRDGVLRPGRLPDHAAGGVLRGGRRPRDDAEAADRQHPRRAARRPAPVPPPARHRRRRQPVGGVDVPQGRDDRARPGDARGRRDAPPRLLAGRSGPGDAPRLDRPHAGRAADPGGRLDRDRARDPVGPADRRPQVRRGTGVGGARRRARSVRWSSTAGKPSSARSRPTR